VSSAIVVVVVVVVFCLSVRLSDWQIIINWIWQLIIIIIIIIIINIIDFVHRIEYMHVMFDFVTLLLNFSKYNNDNNNSPALIDSFY